MNSLYPLHGIVTVLNTPFDESNDLDLKALKRHVSVAMDAGVNGFLVPAMASEVSKLNIKERIQAVEAVLETVDNRVPVFGGTGEKDILKSYSLLKEYKNIGCDKVLFQIPYKDKLQFKDHFRKLASVESDVIMLQDWDFSGYGLPDSLILELFEEFDAFRCLKIETVPAGIKYSRILDLTEGNLNISGGWAVTQMIEGLKRGVHAFMPTGMHYIYTQIYQNFISGNEKEAQNLFEKILPIISFSNQHLDISIQFFKLLLYRQGIYNTPNIRNPILSFDKVHKEIAFQLIERVINMENAIRLKRDKIP